MRVVNNGLAGFRRRLKWATYSFGVDVGCESVSVDRNRAGSSFRRCRTVPAFGACIAPLVAIDAVHSEDSRPFVIGNGVHGAAAVCYEDVHDFLHIDERLSGISSCRNLPVVNPRIR